MKARMKAKQVTVSKARKNNKMTRSTKKIVLYIFGGVQLLIGLHGLYIFVMNNYIDKVDEVMRITFTMKEVITIGLIISGLFFIILMVRRK